MEHFGSVNASHMLFVWIDIDEAVRSEEMKMIEGEFLELEKLSMITNIFCIFQMFEVTAKEKEMHNGDCDAVYNRVALKNI